MKEIQIGGDGGAHRQLRDGGSKEPWFVKGITEIAIATCRQLAAESAEAAMPVAVDATGGDGTSRIRKDAVQL